MNFEIKIQILTYVSYLKIFLVLSEVSSITLAKFRVNEILTSYPNLRNLILLYVLFG